MKKPPLCSLKESPKRGRRLAAALLLTAFLSCTTEVVGPQIGTELVLATSAAGAVNGVPFATPPSVHIVDDQGNTVTEANFPVTLTVSSGATVIGSSTVSAVNGIAVFSSAGLTGPAGTYTLTYTATLAVGPRTVSQSITLAPGAAARYIVTSSASSATVGTPVTINAQLVDANDSPISAAGRIVNWSASGANGSFSAPTSSTNASGLATVTYTVDTVDGRTATITATDNNSISGSTTVSTLTGSAAKLAFNVQPSAAGWRTVIRPSVIVTVQDRYSNTVASGATPVTLSIGANPGGATLSGGESTPSAGGIATFPNVMFDEPGSGYTLIASSPGLTSVTSASFDVSPIGVLVSPPPPDQCFGGGCPVKSLAVSASTVYFTPCTRTHPSSDRFCSISAIARTGGVANKLADGMSEQFSFNTYGGRLIVDGTHVDLLRVGGGNLRSGSIFRVPLAGGSSSTLRVAAPSASSGPDLEFDGTSFYMNWSPALGDGTSGIGRTRASDEVSEVLVSHFSPFAVAGGQLYFTSAGTIEKMSVDGGPTTIVVTGVGALEGPSYRWRQMLVVDNTIYWVEGSALRSGPISGGVATTRASGVAAPLVSDGTYLYARGNNSVLRIRLTDFSVTPIASGADGIVDLAVDSEAVYWATPNGFVKKARK